MSSDDKQNDWSQDPSLSGIDFARLQALQQMASQKEILIIFLYNVYRKNQMETRR